MFLRRITVAGFKSFATRTTLELEPGVTAVVGPNGSGKSNIADAIRWGLGEQSRGSLRLSDREEVIFAGSDGRAKASLAEVILVFDNSDGAFPLELTEVELSRRLYRSGESEYLLAGRKVALREIQSLLSGTGYGSGAYAVIGQGMIDSFLTGTPAERKVLFDEAAGIRGPELKRAEGLKQLEQTHANLTRLRDIQGELEARLPLLERGMKAAEMVTRVEQELTTARQAYCATADAEIAAAMVDLARVQDSMTREAHHLRHAIAAASARQHQLIARSHRHAELQASARLALTKCESARVQAEADYNKARLAVSGRDAVSEQLTELRRVIKRTRAEHAAATAQAAQLTTELVENAAASESARVAYERATTSVKTSQHQLLELRSRLDGDDQKAYVNHALQLLKAAALSLDGGESGLIQVRLLVHKAGRLLSHANRDNRNDVASELKNAQEHLEAAMARRETAAQHQGNITITRRSLELDMTFQSDVLSRLASALTEAEQKEQALIAQLKHFQGAEADIDQLADRLSKAQSAVLQAHVQITVPETFDTTAVSEVATELERSRSRMSIVNATLSELGPQRRRLNDSRQQLTRIGEEWNIAVDPVSAQKLPAATLYEQVIRLEADLAARRGQVKDTAAEYEDVRLRTTRQAAQIADLEQAETNLTALARELDGLIRERFTTNFASLSEHFNTTFAQLFEGGSASLMLDQSGDEYGVDITVRLKGKRLTAIGSLSGGERALAGIALLGAILQVNPSPFVVLDEVDAALDEANSGRLGLIIGSLAEHSQLIVITHNRQTMHAANVLYGVTMDARHVSALLSVRLDEATALAAR